MNHEEAVFVENAMYLGAYRIQLSFTDGYEVAVDFEEFLRRSNNPCINKYLEPERFQQFSVVDGDLQWNDYDLCFPIADLYENNLSGLSRHNKLRQTG